ncbi:MAG: hypothetical protein JW971_03935 [Synergistales bacterium]|nr:hypothetical protein [Synergistales bacterium]
MIHDKQRIARMAEELISDLFRYDCKDMDLRILDGEGFYTISISGSCKGMKSREVSRIRKLLDQPRNSQMEEYYWSLSGDSDLDTEFSLLGIMSDEVELNYDEGSGTLFIKLTRKK